MRILTNALTFLPFNWLPTPAGWQEEARADGQKGGIMVSFIGCHIPANLNPQLYKQTGERLTMWMAPPEIPAGLATLDCRSVTDIPPKALCSTFSSCKAGNVVKAICNVNLHPVTL